MGSELDLLAGYTPADFGLDEYEEYRRHPLTGEEVQLQVVEFAACLEKRVAAGAVPVGVGKSLIAVTLAKMLGMRTAIVVPLKGLQEQYGKTFDRHVFDIRGRANYACDGHPGFNCKEGAAVGCSRIRAGTCRYECAVKRAKTEDVIVTNYDYWLTKNAKGKGLGEFGLLVLDEGDEAAFKVAEFLAVRVYEREIESWCKSEGVKAKDVGDDLETWLRVACWMAGNAEKGIAECKRELTKKATRERVDELQRLERLLEKMARIATVTAEDWVIERQDGTRYGRVWSFDVVWPGRYTEQSLFCRVPKVVVLSGTLTTRDLAQMGVRREDYSYRQWDRMFPAQRQPVYLCPARYSDGTSIRIDKRTSADDLQAWVAHMDAFIGRRLDRKGLIITTSYEWQRFIQMNSRHAERMIGNTGEPESETAGEKFAEFAALEPGSGAILISPSFSRGWSFDYELAEYLILPKCPFVPMQSKVAKARLERDKAYGDNQVMKRIQQADGRIKRAADDQGETLLCDGHFEHFLYRCAGLAQEWFVRGVRRVRELPEPLPKLGCAK